MVVTKATNAFAHCLTPKAQHAPDGLHGQLQICQQLLCMNWQQAINGIDLDNRPLASQLPRKSGFVNRFA